MNDEQLAKIACYWTTYKDIEFTSEDVKKMLELLRIAETAA